MPKETSRLSPDHRAKLKGPRWGAIPERASGDHELTALDLRVFILISCYDGRSLERGLARGCDVKNSVLAAKLECTPESLSRSIRKLCDRAYLSREYQSVKGRGHMTVYRVIFAPNQLSIGAIDQLSGRDNRSIIRNTAKSGESLIRERSENDRNPLRNERQKNSLKGKRGAGEQDSDRASPAAIRLDEDPRALASEMAKLRRDPVGYATSMNGQDGGSS